MTHPLVALGALGQSPWYDFITRDLLRSGELARLIREDGLKGMTSNPTIFEKAITGSADYDADIAKLAKARRRHGRDRRVADGGGCAGGVRCVPAGL